jgi:hypothetical protein
LDHDVAFFSTMSATTPNNKRSAKDAGLPDGDTNAPCCWVCLEEGPDDKSGLPLVRDCSCRGSSGFAHLSCIIKNAESHGRRVAREDVDVNPGVFAKAFEFCPNCKQQYQNDVIYKLTKAAVDFTEREYKDFNCGYLLSMTLSNRLTVIDPKNNADDRVEGEESCTKIISIIDDMKRNESLAQVWKEMYIYSEAKAFGAVASFYMHVDTEESLTKAKLYYTKARDIFREKGDEIPMLMAEKKIAEIEAKIGGEENMCIDTHQKIYAYLQRTIGESDPQTIRAGVDVAEALCLSFRAIEGERLLSKLVELSKRVHGMEHECTKRTTSYLQRMKERIVVTQDGQPFIALRYENDGDVCIVKDPTVDDETESKISASKVVPYLGTPVLTLQQSTHLNGKIGDVRHVDLEKGMCQVHFEEAGLEHAEIKYENLRILFELPPAGA